MKTELKDVMHFYLGVQCKCEETEYTPAFEGKLVKVDVGEYERFYTVETNSDCYEYDNEIFYAIKPILRPLSDMTEEEKITIGLIIVEKERKHYRNNNDLFAIEDAEAWAIRGGMRPALSLMQTTKLTTFLLKQGFDLFDLISSGQAIDKTTLNK